MSEGPGRNPKWEAVAAPEQSAPPKQKTSGSAWGAWLLVGFLVGWQIYVTGMDATTDTGTLIRFGARKPSFGFPQAPWRLVASMFLHGGWFHLVCNVMLIGIWGSKLSRLVGPLALLAVFLVTGIWGSLLSDIYGPEALAVGASGGASGLVFIILALALLAPSNPRWDGEAKQWLQSSVVVLVLNLVLAFGMTTASGSGARLDHWAHSGGALAGFLLGVVASRDTAHRNRGLWSGLLVAVLAAAGTILFRGSSPFG